MNKQDRDGLAQQVLTMQIIVFALAAGIVTFAVVLLVVIQPEPDEEAAIIAYVAAAFALVLIPAAFVIPRLFAARLPPSVATYQTTLIIGVALLEGAAFFNLMGYLVAGQQFSLAIAGVLVLLILSHMPTASSVADWIETRQRQEREAEAFTRRD